MPKREKFDKITQEKGRKIQHNGDSPSGKATVSDSVIRAFESLIPSQKHSVPTGTLCFLAAIKRKNVRGNGRSREAIRARKTWNF